MDKIIKSLDIVKTKIPKIGENRTFTIRGTKGASFILQVVNGSNQFYNFSTKAFTVAASHIPENNFKGTLSGTSFSGLIQFPVVSGAATYNVIVIADASTDTVVDSKGGVINQSIRQALDTVISFRLLSDTSNYATLPAATTSTATPAKTGGAVVSISDTATNASTDAGGFGLILSRQPLETDLVFRNTQTVDGTISSLTTVVLDSVSDLALGTLVIGVSSGSLSGTPSIKTIDTATKTITLSAAQSFGDGITLTFEARGPKAIYNAIGVTLSKIALKASAPSDSIVTKTVRTAPSASTTINLNGTYGIAGGDIVVYKGFDVDSSTANAVTSVTASSSAGSIVVEKAQTLTVGTLLTFKGCNSKIDVNYKFEIFKFSNTNRTINLILDNFITPGAAS